jgi:hypothetical protein
LASDPRAAWLQRDGAAPRDFTGRGSAIVRGHGLSYNAGLPVFGPITPANKRWYWSGDAADAGRSGGGRRRSWRRLDLADRNHDGVLEDASGRAAQFTLLTQKGRSSLERGVAVIQTNSRRSSLVVDVAPLDGGRSHQRILSSKRRRVSSPDVSGTDPAARVAVPGAAPAAAISVTWHRRRRPPIGNARSTS